MEHRAIRFCCFKILPRIEFWKNYCNVLYWLYCTRSSSCFTMGTLWCSILEDSGVEKCIQNYLRIPRALFGKAWITTGHITAEELMQHSDITQEDLDHCHLLSDPLSLSESLGVRNIDGPSIEELVEQGSLRRRRVVWELSGKEGSGMEKFLCPAALVGPVEKKLANYLFLKAHKRPSLKLHGTILLSRRTGKEISADLLKKHSVLHHDGRRKLKADVPTRTAKDQWPEFPWLLHVFWIPYLCTSAWRA